jgi:hypothetical protein
MAGLLSLFGQTTGDPNRDAAVNQGLLQAGLAMLQGKGNFGQVLGQGGQAGVQGYQSAQDRQFQANQQEQQKKKWQQEQEALQRQRAMQELAKKYYLTPEQASLQNGKGPTLENAAKIGSPSFDFEGYANALAQYDPVGAMELRQRMAKPTRKLTTVGPGGSLVDEANGQVVYSAPAKDDAPSAIKEYQFAVGQGYKGSFADWDQARRKAGASSVSVNTGQKGLDNTLKVREAFRGEPIYKAHQEMQSAYAQIQQSLKQNSPAGDLAGATKVMKLLDPGSVVRESELGMAMQASGLLDRVQHYATNVLNGTKLTPAQRKDFQKLADALYGESVKQYNSKRGEYQGIAQRNGLNEEDVLGNPSAAPSRNVVNFNDLK